MSPASFITKFQTILQSLPDCQGYLIAYSGGMDSHVLLHAMYALRTELPAPVAPIHINHGLSANAPAWQQHCQKVCADLGLALETVTVDARCPAGESPESWARRKRYEVLADRIGPGRVLLTAHHKEDQAETLLLQLFRGAGPAGLSAMPLIQSFSSGRHCRPLLDFPRSDLRQYALLQGLRWVEDESNQDLGIDRNYIRHQVLPVIKQHWPGVMETLSRSAQHQAEAAQLQDQLARQDLAGIADGGRLARLDIHDLKHLPVARQKNLIRYWMHMLQLPLPNTGHLQHILDDVIDSPPDAMPCVSWPGVEVRRYRQYLYAAAPLPEHDAGQVLFWDLEQPLAITQGSLQARKTQGDGIRVVCCRQNRVQVRYRSGGETMQPAGRDHHHELKKLLQDQGVPPWLRDRIPLLYIEGKFAGVPGKWIDQEFTGRDDEPCWRITWDGIDKIFLN